MFFTLAFLAFIVVVAAQTYSNAEIAQHNTASSCWVIVNSEVFDITPFLNSHPGGRSVLVNGAGKDISAQFRMFHKASVINKYRSLQIGTVGASSSAGNPVPASNPAPSSSGGSALVAPIALPAAAGQRSCAGLADRDKRCGSWGQYCAEPTYVVWMGQNCGKSCCQIANPVPPQQTSCNKPDTNPTCRQWLQECNPSAYYYSFMMVNCAQSCCRAASGAANQAANFVSTSNYNTNVHRGDSEHGYDNGRDR